MEIEFFPGTTLVFCFTVYTPSPTNQRRRVEGGGGGGGGGCAAPFKTYISTRTRARALVTARAWTGHFRRARTRVNNNLRERADWGATETNAENKKERENATTNDGDDSLLSCGTSWENHTCAIDAIETRLIEWLWCNTAPLLLVVITLGNIATMLMRLQHSVVDDKNNLIFR